MIRTRDPINLTKIYLAEARMMTMDVLDPVHLSNKCLEAGEVGAKELQDDQHWIVL